MSSVPKVGHAPSLPSTARWMSALPWVLAVVALSALAAMPTFGGAYLTTFVFTALIAYILGQSWDWVAGEMGYVNLGHYVFYGIGAYVFALLLVQHYPFAIAAPIAVVATMAGALVLSLPLFRLQGDYFSFATLALLPLAELLAFNLSPITRGADGVVLPVAQTLQPAYLMALALCVLSFAVTVWINRARFGFALKAIRNDEQVAETVGVRIGPAKRAVLVLSSGFAALAGALQSWQMSYIDPPTVFGLGVALAPIAMVLFGGSGLRWGPIVGVLVLASLQQWLLIYAKAFHATIYGALILLIGRFMPGGVLRSGLVRRIPLLRGLSREHHEYLGAGVPLPSAVPATSLPLPRRPADQAAPILCIEGLRKEFGGNVAINDISLSVARGEIVGLVGANGSGKTTLFNCISRVFAPTRGQIVFDGRDLARCSRDQIARLGVGRTYQIPRPFGDLTVQENVAMPLMFGPERLAPTAALRQARGFIDYAGLSHRLLDRADRLSVQEKKALEFARALAGRPQLLLVDEVASGLTPVEVRRFVEQIRHVRDEYGITVIWVEHIFSALAQVVDRVVVLEQGSVIADGALQAVMRDQRVLDSYLGSAAKEAA